MVSVQQQQGVHSAHDSWIQRVVLTSSAEGHGQEVGDVAKRGVWVNELLAKRVLVRIGRDGGQCPKESEGGDLNLILCEGIQLVLIVGRECRDCRRQDRHRVSVAREACVQGLQPLWHDEVPVDLSFEFSKRGTAGKLAVDEQIGGLKECRLLCKLLDRIAAVAQDAVVSIDKGNGR